MPLILPASDTPRDHLIIPDDHRHPEDNWRRFDALGNYIVEHKPEVIVFLGDSADMASLCSFDKGKKEMVFKNVKADIESYHTGEEHIFSPLLKENNRLRQAHKPLYTPIVVKLRGNHEYRVQRLLDYEPKWEGSVSMDSFTSRFKFPEIIVPFMDFIAIDDIYYSHYWVSGVKAQPVGSAKLLISKKGVSATMGHVHTLDVASMPRPDGSLMRGLIAGSFHDPDHKSFAGVQVDDIWWNGLIHKHDVLKGDYDLEEIKVGRLLKNYT